MRATFQSEKYIKFVIYAAVVVLVNIAASTLFFRMDLTQNKLYSLSPASKAAVAKLSEPLTINVFFTENLPAPHNGTQQYLRDMLEEYAISSNKNFNYRFYDVSPQEEGGAASDKTAENQKLAENYGIAPVEIRMFEKDELKFKKAYMGMVMIQGDIIEKIPAITSTDGLEYKLTTLIEKLNKKISTLAGLQEKIKVKLFMSSSIDAIAPLIGIKNIAALPDSIKQTVERLNNVNYGQLAFERIDPATDAAVDDLIKAYNIRVLQWPDIPEQNIRAGRGAIGMTLEYKKDKTYLQLMNVMRIPIIGTRYELIDTASLEETINETVETLVGINEDVGYLADHGALSLANPMMGMQPQTEESLQNFQTLVNENYSIKPVMLKENPIPESLGCLIIAQPTEPFTDYELYQIDQALMRGTNLAIFTDGLKEMPQPQQQQFQFNMGPTYQPLATGLEKLLDHYGVKVKPAYILDKNCFKQQMPPQAGGGERPIYFAPMIKNEFINHDLDFMNNIKGMIALNASPILLDNEAIKNNGLTASTLVSSSDESWEMSGQINLNPMLIQPPQSSEMFKSIALAALVEGNFSSYYKDKTIPVREKASEEKNPEEMLMEEDITPKNDTDAKPDANAAKVESKETFIASGKPGKIVIVGSSAMLKDNLLDAEGVSPNAAFILNLIDTLNGRNDIAAMRSKIQQFNPLEETSARTKNIIKGFNVAGLPVIIVLMGLMIWWRRSVRRKNIRLMFQK